MTSTAKRDVGATDPVWPTRSALPGSEIEGPIGRFVETAGGRLHVVDAGGGPPIVLLHGLTGTLDHFHALAPLLVADHRVVAIDRPGAGHSDRADAQEAGPFAQAATVATALDALGVRDALLVGHSLGGTVALALAVTRPDLVRGLALLCPAARLQSVPLIFRGLNVRSDRARHWLSRTVAVPMARLIADWALARAFAPETPVADYRTRAGGDLALSRTAYVESSRDLVGALDGIGILVRRYGEIAVPVSVLFGRGDTLTDPTENGDALQRELPDVRIEIVEGGHMLPLTQPERVARWIREVDPIGATR